MRGGREKEKMKVLSKLTIVALLAMTIPAHAGENLGAIDVSIAEAGKVSAANSHAVTVIDREQIEASHALYVVDILKGIPGIIVSDTSGTGAKARIDLGGYGETALANSVVLIDGRRINSPDLSGTDWTQIPVSQIERIEIVHGGGSTLYGDGAVGGAINIVTRIPESGGKAVMGGGSFGSYDGSLNVGADTGNARVETSFSTSKSDGYRVNSLFERVDAGARAEIDMSDSLSFRLNGNHHQDRAGLPGSLTAAQVASDRKQSNTPNDFSRTSDNFVDAGLNWLGERVELDLSGGLRDRKTHGEYPSFGGVNDIAIRTLNVRPKLGVSFGGSVPIRLQAGADFDDSRGLFEFSGAFPLPATTIKRKRSGYYLQSTAGEGRWNVTAGVRSEGIRDNFSQGAVSQISNRKVVWELGGMLRLADAASLRVSANSSVRFPLLDERYSFFSGLVDSTLKPQTGNHYAAALRYALENVWVELSLSRADLTNEIYYNPIGGAFGFGANENYTDKTRHDVAMLAGHVDGGKLLQFGGNVCYVNATFRGGFYNSKTIPAVAKLRAGADWRADWSEKFNSLVKLTYIGDSYLISDQANARPKLPAYLLVDVVANYRINSFDLFARIDNLTNKKYSSYGVYSAFTGDNFYPASGIGVRAGASYRF